MKTFFVLLAATCSFFLTAYAEASSCRRQAVTAARGSTFSTDRLYEFEETVAKKNYLLSFVVTFADSLYAPRKIEVYDVILMKSDCSIVSVKPRL